MQRIRTGNEAADLILGGGFPAHSIHVIMGLPGSGKTIFAEQLAFANLGDRRPVLYLTTISEPLPKVLTFLQEFTFARVEAVGTQIVYESIADTIIQHAERLPERVLELVQQHRPSIIVFDSFKAIGDLMPDVAAWRRVLYDLAGHLSAYDTTTLWIGEYVADMVAVLPEFAVADGIVELVREPHGTRDDRYMRVVKLRGSDFLGGYHAFRIGKGGLEIFPRLVSPADDVRYAPHEERLQTGIRGLDQMIDTGWLRGTTALVLGPSGAGKTLLGLHFLREGVRVGERGLLVTFQENPTQLARIMRHLGWKPNELLSGGLDVLYASPVELTIDSIAAEIFRRIERSDVKRVVIDALGDLLTASPDAVRFRDYAYALTQRFSLQNVTAMMTMETQHRPETLQVSPMADSILLLEMRFGETLERTIRIVKTRGSGHEGRRFAFRIAPEGLVIDRAR